MKTLNDLINQKRESVNAYLTTLLVHQNKFDAPITEAMRYSLLSGGKRLRAVLLLETAQLLGAIQEKAMPFAAGIEMIHAYSLIHDDLPAMDDDDMRRGKPTCHKVYGNAMAILAGDALLNYAYEHMLSHVIIQPSDVGMVRALHDIAVSSGYKGMLGGQVIDVMSENQLIDHQTIDFIHAHKTAKLIETALISGAYIGGADDALAHNFKKFGYHLGMAFQIIDDILDIEGDVKLLGKATGADGALGKATYPAIYGLDVSKKVAKQHTQSALEILKTLAYNTDALEQIAVTLLDRDY